MRPCDCKSTVEAATRLNEQGISFNNDSLEVRPGIVLLTIGPVDIKIPMSRFKQFAEWYLEDQAPCRFCEQGGASRMANFCPQCGRKL